jgi:hypothetical protein
LQFFLAAVSTNKAEENEFGFCGNRDSEICATIQPSTPNEPRGDGFLRETIHDFRTIYKT